MLFLNVLNIFVVWKFSIDRLLWVSMLLVVVCMLNVCVVL